MKGNYIVVKDYCIKEKLINYQKIDPTHISVCVCEYEGRSSHRVD